MSALRKNSVLAGGGLFLLALLVYLPSLSAGFIWDDDVMLTGNPIIKAGNGLYYIWCSTRLPDYFPLTSTSLWLEWRLWGMHPFGYHLTNILLHALNAMLLWRVLRRLSIPGAWLAAAVWAVHPVCVASAAWISECKNTLAFCFCALSLLWYLRYLSPSSPTSQDPSLPQPSTLPPRRSASEAGNPQPPYYWLSLGAFLLALLSKTSVVMLPMVLLLCVWWRAGTLTRRDVVRVLPFFALALVLGLVTLWFQSGRGLAGGTAPVSDPRLVRLLAGSRAVWFYLWKAVAPVDLMMIYPRWQLDPHVPAAWLPSLGLVTLGALFWWRRARWGRACLFAFGYVTLMLLPVLGFFQMGFLAYAQVADHWQYLSLPGVVAWVVGGGAWIWRHTARPPPGWAHLEPVLTATLLLGLLGGLSWHHQRAFASAEALWRDNLAANPKAWVAHNSLGVILEQKGNPVAALEHYQQALRLNPQDPASHYNLANTLAQQGQLPEAIAHYQESLRLQPANPGAHLNLAIAWNLQGQYAAAVAQCVAALQITPEDPNIEDTLGTALMGQEQWVEASRHFAAALQLDPRHANAHDHLGRLLARQGDYPNAVAQFRAALEAKPDHAQAALDLGKALSALGQFPAAAEQYAAALRLQPRLAEAQYNWALLCLKQAQPAQAVSHYRAALNLRPDYPDALNNLAWLLATSSEPSLRNGAEAVRLAEHACDLTQRKQARFLGTLDAAYAETGRFSEAMATAEQARQLALAAGEAALAEAASRRLDLYRANRPFHE